MVWNAKACAIDRHKAIIARPCLFWIGSPKQREKRWEQQWLKQQQDNNNKLSYHKWLQISNCLNENLWWLPPDVLVHCFGIRSKQAGQQAAFGVHIEKWERSQQVHQDTTKRDGASGKEQTPHRNATNAPKQKTLWMFGLPPLLLLICLGLNPKFLVSFWAGPPPGLDGALPFSLCWCVIHS